MLGHNIRLFDKAHHSKRHIVHLSLLSRLHHRVAATTQHVLTSQLCSSTPRQTLESIYQVDSSVFKVPLHMRKAPGVCHSPEDLPDICPSIQPCYTVY